MKPYYQHAGITIYHGDCRDILPTLGPVDMMFTDPPYGVDYTGGHFHSGDVHITRERERLQGDKTTSLYNTFLPLAIPLIDGPCYMWFAGSRGLEVYQSVSDAGCDIHALIIWHKINATYAAMFAQYKQRHEPCLYFKSRSATLRWIGPSNECTVWDIPRDPINCWHPTQKPVALAQRALGNHNASTVLDPFMGSGTTLVAAKNLGRQAIGIEIEEKYCEIAAKRLSQEVFAFPELRERPDSVEQAELYESPK